MKKLQAVALVVAVALCGAWLIFVNNREEQPKYQLNCEARIAGGAYICR